jgi:cob(I)alamin adenosyltransferase
MTNADKLKNLLELEIIPDLEAAIDELFAAIDKAKTASTTQKEDLEEMREMRTECFAIVEELGRGELEEDEVDELLAELVEMKTEEE